MCLLEYEPLNDLDFSLIIDHFHGLQELLIPIDYLLFPTAAEISVPIMHLFFEYIHSIPSAKLSLFVEDIVLFLKEYFTFFSKNIYQSQSRFLHLSLVDTDNQVTNDGIFHVKLMNGSIEIILKFDHSIAD